MPHPPHRRIKSCILLAAACGFAPPSQAAESRLEFTSSSPQLTRAFSWAKAQALAYVFDGDPVGPWYEAALPGRAAFCMRDLSHQAIGAHALGLALYTRNMLHRFAASISASRDWCGLWEINRYNRPPPEDYRDDAQFWYCLPANFDLVDTCYRMFRWSGDETYLNDPLFLNFYRQTATNYSIRWQLDPAHVMSRPRLLNIRGALDPRNNLQVYRGNPSYEEARRDFVLGVDLLAAEYAALDSYAHILDARGEHGPSAVQSKQARLLRTLIEDQWWDAADGRFRAFLTSTREFAGHDEADVLYWHAVAKRPEIDAAVQALVRRTHQAPAPIVEVQSHFAEVLYHYGASEAATSQILDLARYNRPRREYPEVSFSVIGAIVTGLMGIDAASPGSTITTLPTLGRVQSTVLRHLPVHGNLVSVRHANAGTRTLLTNESGPDLLWQASFRASCRTILINGQPTAAHPGRGASGAETCSTTIRIPPGASAEAELTAR